MSEGGPGPRRDQVVPLRLCGVGLGHGCSPAGPRRLARIALARTGPTRRSISSGVRSSMWEAMLQRWPKGSELAAPVSGKILLSTGRSLASSARSGPRVGVVHVLSGRNGRATASC